MPETEREANLSARQRTSVGFRAAFPRTVLAWRATVDVGAIAAGALDADLIAPAMNFGTLSDAIQLDIDRLIGPAVRAGADIAPAFTPAGVNAVPLSVEFATQRYVAESSASLVSLIDSDARAGLRETIASAIRDELPRDQAAALIGRQAGLTRRQVISVNNFAENAGKVFVFGDEVLTDAAIRRLDAQVDAFEMRILNHRGAVIAQTETQNAIQAGERAYWEAALDDPATPFVRGDVVKIWHVVGANICPICLGIPSTPVPFDEFFQSSSGWVGMHPTAHPLCKCYVEYRVQQP